MTQPLHDITPDRVDPDAAKVVRRISRKGFEAYLVGGCVRDLLLGREPKDFDLATSATPDELKRLFGNCRIIGRRFRLAHIFFGPKIIETATFRRPPEQTEDEENPLIWQDNEFGTAKQDALRRDFTINGLFYDLVKGEVIDNVGGLPDLRQGLIRTIGDPEVRLPEDPVRILRAVKFAARLDLSIEEQTYRAMIRHRGLIAHCSVARVLEEIYRLLRGGSAHAAFEQMHQLGILQVLFPEIAALLPPSDIAEARTVVPAVRAGRRRPRSAARLNATQQADAAELHADDPDPQQPTEADSAPHLDPAPTQSSGQDAEPAENPGKTDAEAEASTVDEHAAALTLLEQLDLTERKDIKQAVKQLWALLAALDELVRGTDRPPSEPLLLGALLSPLAINLLREDKRVGQTVEQIEVLVRSVAKRIHVSKRHQERLKQLLVGQRRLRGRRRGNLHRRDYFEEAYLLLRLRCEAMGMPAPSLRELKEHAPRKKRRRRRRRRPSEAPPQEGPPLSVESGS